MQFHELTNAPAWLIIVAFFLGWGLLWLPIALPLAIALRWRPAQALSMRQKLPLLASLYGVAPVVVGWVGWATQTSWAAYGLPLNASLLGSLVLGTGAGIVGIGLMTLLQMRWGWLARSPVDDPPQRASLASTLASTLLIGVGVGFTEEVIFRGFLINQLSRDVALWQAAAIASVIFAVLHLVWDASQTVPQLPGLWLMGMVLALARWADHGNLGLAWGLHAGWVGAIATIDTQQWLTPTGTVPAWVTGVQGNVLAGLVGILFLLVMAGMIGLWGMKTGF